MQRIEVTTKPNGAGRNWLEVGHFETDELGRKQWVKQNGPHQDRRLKADRQYSARGETIDWIILVPDDYPLTLVRVSYDRLNPREIEVIWEADGGTVQQEISRAEKIKRALELAGGNEELTNLLKELLTNN
ncbi:hypothetical protein IH992_08360 [Candidatus Poribacteria bacterium]|nr:hypothetical protein [Candidatus Poribacteria bacterium]